MLQYYDAAAGTIGRRFAYWGGLQDNGTTELRPGAAANIEPAGEHTNLAMYATTDGGHSFATISPECGFYANTAACDPTTRFIAPFAADVHDRFHWVAAGNQVWDTTKGWHTTCSTTCDWVSVHSFGVDSTGGYNAGTAVAVSGATTYAAWVSSMANPGAAFQSGIDTNSGGTWHRINSPVLPNRYIAGLTVDPANPRHV